MSDTDSLFKRFLFGEATEQQVFDEVRTKLEVQGSRSVDLDGCVYLSDNGARCAIGVLLTQSEINVIEANGWNRQCGASELASRLYPEWNGREGQFIDDLQACHDSANDHDRPFAVGLDQELANFANEYDLVYT